MEAEYICIFALTVTLTHQVPAPWNWLYLLCNYTVLHCNCTKLPPVYIYTMSLFSFCAFTTYSVVPLVALLCIYFLHTLSLLAICCIFSIAFAYFSKPREQRNSTFWQAHNKINLKSFCTQRHTHTLFSEDQCQCEATVIGPVVSNKSNIAINTLKRWGCVYIWRW